MKKYLLFLIVSYLVAFIFEFIANTIGDGRLFQASNWPIFFLAWYGFLYSVSFILFRQKPPWLPAVIWAIVGPILEIVVFKRLNPLVDPLIYALMFFIPFWVWRKLTALYFEEANKVRG